MLINKTSPNHALWEVLNIIFVTVNSMMFLYNYYYLLLYYLTLLLPLLGHSRNKWYTPIEQFRIPKIFVYCCLGNKKSILGVPLISEITHYCILIG